MKIEEIRDVLRFIRSYYSYDHPVLDLKNLYYEKTHFAKLYKILIDTDIKSDEETAKEIYGKPHPDNRYIELKSSFTKSALNSIIFLDLNKPDISEFMRVLYKAHKQFFMTTVLLRLGSRKGAISLAKKTLTLCT